MKLSPPEALGRYRALLDRYHRTLDLVSDRGLGDLDRLLAEADRYADVVGRVAPDARTLLDVGSGAGLPGVVLGVRLSGVRVVLSERRRKRAAFLTLVCAQLGLDNVEVVQGDVTELVGLDAEVVVAQAVGTFEEVAWLTRRARRVGSVLLSRKGPSWRDEVAAVEAAVGAAVTVVAEEPLGHRGTLVALRFAGGTACPSSV